MTVALPHGSDHIFLESMQIRLFSKLQLKIATPQDRLFLFLLAYRWISLIIAFWLSQVTADQFFIGQSAEFWFSIAAASTLLISLFNHQLNEMIREDPFFLGVDLFLAGVLLTLTGATESPYTLFVLSPLLAGAFFFQLRGALWAAASFTLVYLATLLIAGRYYPPFIAPSQLLNQLFEIWLVTILFGGMSRLLTQLQQAHRALAQSKDEVALHNQQLAAAHTSLQQQNEELSAAHQQLEIIYDLTLMLQGASDVRSAQQRVLRAVTDELDFRLAIIGLSDHTDKRRLDHWAMRPPKEDVLATLNAVSLHDSGLFLAQELLAQRSSLWTNDLPLFPDEALNAWFGQTPWLILPLVLQEELVGVLLVALDGSFSKLTEEQSVVLSAVASQAAVALGTIDSVKQLAVAQERNRIAREIHDSVAQSLFGTVFTLDACIKMLPDQVETVQHELVDLRNLAEQVRQEVRHSIFNLWPTELTLEQYQTDLRKYVAHCAGSDDFQVDFTIGGNFNDLSPTIRRGVYRITQEALANAVRHAQVNSARVSLYVEPKEIQLSIRDQGRGFDPKIVLARAHNRDKFGLRGIQERVEALHGQCEILSQTEQGTQILVRIPTNGRSTHGL
jgi:signal transduction histidine kinase